MKQLTMNEINEVSGGNPIVSFFAGYVGSHALDRVFSAFNSWAIANSTPSWSYEECEEYMANLPLGSIE